MSTRSYALFYAASVLTQNNKSTTSKYDSTDRPAGQGMKTSWLPQLLPVIALRLKATSTALEVTD